MGWETALIQGGMELIGGLLKKPEKTETTIDYQKMVRNAEKAGFNPLTVLRNGGSAGFTSTVQHPGLSRFADALSTLGGGVGAALEEHNDPLSKKRNAAEEALLDWQLGAFKQGPAWPGRGFVPSQEVASTSPVTGHSPRLGTMGVPANYPAHVVEPDSKAPQASSIGLERAGFYHDPKIANAEQWEKRYGEPGEWVGGVFVMGADTAYNADRFLNMKSARIGEAARKSNPELWGIVPRTMERLRPEMRAKNAEARRRFGSVGRTVKGWFKGSRDTSFEKRGGGW